MNAPAGFIYPGDPGFPVREHRPEEAVAELLAARRTCVGRERRRAHGGPVLLRDRVRLPDRRAAQHQHAVAAVGQPLARRESAGWLRQSRTGITAAIRIRSSRAGRCSSFRSARSARPIPNINSPRVQSWNVTIERQLGIEWGVAASYLGSYTDRLWMQIQLNPAEFLGTGPCMLAGVSYPGVQHGRQPQSAAAAVARRAESGFGRAHWQPRSAYEHRRRRTIEVSGCRSVGAPPTGVSLTGNYTISRCFGDNTTGGFPQLAQGPTNPDDPDADRGHCDQDRTHLANFTVGYQTPEIANPRCARSPRTGASPAS